MRHLICILSIALLSTPVLAQTGRITKAKGGRAIVDFGNHPVSEGQMVSIGGGKSSGAQQGRQHGIAYRFLNSSLKMTPGSTESKAMEVEAEYGYNMGNFEIGGLFSMSSEEAGSSKESTMKFGGFGRYNFITNAPGNNFVPYVSGGLLISNTESGSSKGSGNIFFGGAGVNYFPWGQIFSVDAGLRMNQGSYKYSNATVTTSGFDLYAGWKVYF